MSGDNIFEKSEGFTRFLSVISVCSSPLEHHLYEVSIGHGPSAVAITIR